MNAIWSGVSTRRGALGVLVVLAVAICGYALFAPRVALAQLPDSGAQRNEMIRELQDSNRKLAEIATLLREIRDQGAAKEAARKDNRPTSRP